MIIIKNHDFEPKHLKVCYVIKKICWYVYSQFVFFLFCILIAQFILNEDTIFNVMEFFFAEKTRSVFHEGGVPGVVFF